MIEILLKTVLVRMMTTMNRVKMMMAVAMKTVMIITIASHKIKICLWWLTFLKDEIKVFSKFKLIIDVLNSDSEIAFKSTLPILLFAIIKFSFLALLKSPCPISVILLKKNRFH